jgi:hypothetical protein
VDGCAAIREAAVGRPPPEQYGAEEYPEERETHQAIMALKRRYPDLWRVLICRYLDIVGEDRRQLQDDQARARALMMSQQAFWRALREVHIWLDGVLTTPE